MNKFMIGVQGDRVVIMAFNKALSPEDAVLLAAWLVAIADPGREKFEAAYKEVTNS